MTADGRRYFGKRESAAGQSGRDVRGPDLQGARAWGRSDAAAARQHLKNCADALELILLAAAGSGDSQAPSQLPAVLVSFAQWCDQTREDFQLGAAIDEQLDQRRQTDSFNRTYRQWRAMQREDPDMSRMLGFKDDPTKRDDEYLRLTLETVPLWRPGHSMRAPFRTADVSSALPSG